MAVDHETLGTRSQALVPHHVCSAQIKVDPQGLDHRAAKLFLSPKIGSGTSVTYRDRTRLSKAWITGRRGNFSHPELVAVPVPRIVIARG